MLFRSLERLIEDMKKDNNPNLFTNFNNFFANRTQEQRDMLLRKGVFPYEFFNSPEKLNFVGVPDKNSFYSHLNEKHISQEDYEHVKKVYNSFNITKFGDYMELYLWCDVMLLADMFENYRDDNFNIFKLDPVFYVSAASFFEDALYLYTGAKVYPVTDPEMYRMIDKGKYGGISVASLRFATANNRYMGSLHNPDEASKYLLYIDMINQYGRAMCECLPFRVRDEWMSEEELAKVFDDLVNQRIQDPAETDGETINDIIESYFLKVDLQCPLEIHYKVKDYLPAPEKMSIDVYMMSELQRDMMKN